jgi:two-component system nitrogen regulation sensor histidine kinase NtrY
LFHLISRNLIAKHFLLGSFLFLLVTQGGRWLLLQYKIPVFIYDLKLFSPDIYASSTYNPSLGDFLSATFFLLWLLILIKPYGFKPTQNKALKILQLTVVAWLCMVLADAAFDSIKSLVFDSQVSFDIRNIYSINLFTLLGLLLAFMLLLIAYQMFIDFMNC